MAALTAATLPDVVFFFSFSGHSPRKRVSAFACGTKSVCFALGNHNVERKSDEIHANGDSLA